MKAGLRAWAEVDLDAIGHNVTEIKKCLRSGVRLMGVVKADAYGHGVFEVATEVLSRGADYLAVAFCDEAVELRKKGIDAPILILGNSAESDIDAIIDYDVTATVSDKAFAEALSTRAAEKNKEVSVHIKVDTGMSRIGFLADSEENLCDSCSDICYIAGLDNVEIEGMFTHFASADEIDEAYTRMQYGRFVELNERLEKNGVIIPLKHVCNSAALVKFPEMQMDMVRAGIILYGMYPSMEFDKKLINLVPAMCFKARVAHLKKLSAGSCLSYGMTHSLERDSEIATVAVGYADGYSRNLSNRAKVFVNGTVVEQIGRICMDQCMIDVTWVNNINIGDEVTLFGGAEPNGVSVDSVAELLGTINYEVTCGISRRVPRVYIKDGKTVEIHNRLL